MSTIVPILTQLVLILTKVVGTYLLTQLVGMYLLSYPTSRPITLTYPTILESSVPSEGTGVLGLVSGSSCRGLS